MKMVVSVYKTERKAGLFLYINKQTGIEAVPAELKQLMGHPVHVMDMLLTPEKPLAHIDAEKVLSKITSQGYYLQMPVPEEKDDYMITLPDELLCFNDPQ
ncbi:YcgL domain-containing protein [Sansalvadorimonas sp. 2012CJ34-2]|uniref:YcgL domain-containing protein M3P05_14415 n=1 Tax=Parendozoicomonas callyspongiae TaxID=2942213 RepID=A0ABT0PIN1_9GAMM|nr:YcgL domain-containing protein [Sansalvadorimonas sp. 2012CJ34-2]MCL6271116.1 YcgL domain-containing protein [Sansalvadorimonas sp. 2012CJ34-2]